ncbi:hypothetical protein ACHWQZ_G005930 [Mnemiopsis leidyi]
MSGNLPGSQPEPQSQTARQLAQDIRIKLPSGVDVSDPTPPRCHICFKQFHGAGAIAKQSLTRHLREVHEGKKGEPHVYPGFDYRECTECSTKFIGSLPQRKSNFKRHWKGVHMKLKNFSCDFCGKFYNRKHDMQRHVMKQHRDQLEADYEVQDSKGLIICLCGQSFRGSYARRSLSKHWSSKHLGIKDYSCEVCGKRFARKGDLRRHGRKLRSCSAPAIQ